MTVAHLLSHDFKMPGPVVRAICASQKIVQIGRFKRPDSRQHTLMHRLVAVG